MIEEDTLYELYWKRKLSQRDIAEKLNCSRGKIQNWMNKYEILSRGNFRDWAVEELDEEALRKYYIEKEWSQKMISEKFDCSRRTVENRLERFGIEKRSHSECLKIAYEENRRSPPQQTGKEHPRYGKTVSEETRKKQRKSAIKRLKRRHGNQLQPNYSLEACKLIEEYGEKHGYNFQHAENGGEYHIKELGYWVDGYDKEQNVLIEVDEAYHYNQNGELRDKDKRRQRKIEEHLGCEFIRVRIDT